MHNRNQSYAPGNKITSFYRQADDLVLGYSQIVRDRRKFFRNEVPRNITISTSDDKRHSEFDKLLAIKSVNPAKTCIRI
jgi:hypothetical protein